MATQQEVIKKFVESLDKTNLRGTAAVDEAVRACSSFTSYSDLMEHFLADRNNASSGDDFLKRYCGINLDNADTGAITGSDAGGKTVKTAESIVLESGNSTSVYPPSNSFSYKGLTVNVPNASKLNDAQKNIIAGIYTWWLKGGLDLIEQTYGISFSDNDTTCKTINVDFDMGSNSNLTYVWNWNSSVTTIHINSSLYQNLQNSDANGAGDLPSTPNLDRIIAYGLSRPLMRAKINYEDNLPSTIGKGISVLIDGYDDKGKNEILELVNDSTKISRYSISNNTLDTGIHGDDNYDFAMGYMLLRYLAKQTADSTTVEINIPADALEYNGHSYKIYQDGMTWQEAKKYCEDMGGHLVTITDESEQTFVKSLLENEQTPKNSYWMGGYQDQYGNWNWITNEKFTFSAWAPGLPDDAGEPENYIMMYNAINPARPTNKIGEWNDIREDGVCNGTQKNEPFFGVQNFGFICEWETSKDTVSIEYTPEDLANNLSALNSVLEIGKGTDKKPYDKTNDLSVQIAKSEIDFIRWLGKVWGAMTRYEHDANGNVVLDSNGDPKKDTSTTKTVINAGYNTILELDTVFKSVKNISSGKLGAGEITNELTKIGNSIAKIVNYLQQLKNGNPNGGFLNSTVSSSLGIVTNVITCITDGASFPEVQGIVNNAVNLLEQAVKTGVDGIWKNTKFGDWLANNVAGQKVSNFVKNGKVGTVTTAITCLFTAVDKFTKNSTQYAIDGVPKSTAFANSCIDAISGIVNTLSNTYLKKLIGIDADTIFQGVHTVAAAIKFGIQHVAAWATGGDTSQIQFTTTDKTFTDLIGGALKDLITGTTEYEYVFNEKNKKKIYTIKGNNHITNFGSQCTINAGEGNDTVFCHEGTQQNYVDGGNDNDIIFLYGASNKVYGGYGNDSLTIYSDGKTPLSGNIIDGENGDDIILIDGSRANSKGRTSNTIIGNSGDDIIILENTKTDNVIWYNNGDGDDVIFGCDTNDTIKINKSDYTSKIEGSNIKIKIGEGSIILMDAKSKTPKIIKTNEDMFPLGVIADKKQTTLTVKNEFRAGSISLDNYSATFTKVDASGLAKTQTIEISGNSAINSIKGGKGDDIIRGYAGNDTLIGGEGNDMLFGGANNDLLKGGTGADTINGGNGNDTLTGSTGKDIFVYESGSDIITDYKSGEDKIKLNPTSITRSTVKGSDVILTTSNGTLTVKSIKDKVITFIDNNGKTTDKIFFANTSYAPLATGLSYDSKRTILTAGNKFTGKTIDLSQYLPTVTKINSSATSQAVNIVGNSSNNSVKAGKGADTISGGNGNDTILGGAGNDSIFGGNDNDKLYGDAGNDTLAGGNGNDTLTGGAGKDVFVYNSGKDVITDYTAGQDSIKINGSISNVSYNGKNVIFSIGKGSLTVNNAKGKNISVSESNGTSHTYSKTLDLLYDDNFVSDDFEIDSVVDVSDTNYSVEKIYSSNNNDEFTANSIAADSSDLK